MWLAVQEVGYSTLPRGTEQSDLWTSCFATGIFLGPRSQTVRHPSPRRQAMIMNKTVAEHIAKVLDWQNAHARFDAIVAKIPADARGKRPKDLPYSPWQLVEHMRLAQRDILDFCIDPDYQEKEWPRDYWPTDPEPPTPDAWDHCVRAFRKDLAHLQGLATDPDVGLLSTVANDSEVTYLRELLLVVDHNAYHLGQLVVVARLLGVWGS